VALVVGCWALYAEGWVTKARNHGIHRDPGAGRHAGQHAP